jgi:hypothetical protein
MPGPVRQAGAKTKKAQPTAAALHSIFFLHDVWNSSATSEVVP